jgi:hypothetical protein
MKSENELVAERYARRITLGAGDRYSLLNHQLLSVKPGRPEAWRLGCPLATRQPWLRAGQEAVSEKTYICEGGGFWYDFTYNNPHNPDVRGVPVKRIRQLFPEAQMISAVSHWLRPLAAVSVKFTPHFTHCLTPSRFYVHTYCAGYRNLNIMNYSLRRH